MKLPSFVSANFKMGISNLVRLVLSMVKAKLSAVLLGPEGVGLIGLVSQVQMFSACLSSIAIGGSEVTRSLSRSKADTSEKGKILSTATILLVANCIIFIGGLIIFQSQLANAVFHQEGTESFLYPLLLTVPAHAVISTVFAGIFFSHNRIGGYTVASIFGIVAEVALFVWMVKEWGIRGALWSTAIGTFVSFSVGLFFIKWMEKEEGLSLKMKFHFDKEISAKLIKSGVIGTSTGLLTYGANVFYRSMFYKMEDTHASGHYHVAVLFSSIYLPFLTNAVWSSFHPKVSAHGINEDTIKEWKSYLIQIALLGGWVQFTISLMSPFFIRLIYTGDFIPAAHAVPLFMLGDFFYLLAQPGIAVFLSLEKNRKYFLSLAFFNFIAIGISYFSIPAYGVDGAAYAYLTASIFLFLVSSLHLVYRAGWAHVFHLLPTGVGSFLLVATGVVGFYTIRSFEVRLTLLAVGTLALIFLNLNFFKKRVK